MSWRFFLLAVYAAGLHTVDSQCTLGYISLANGSCSQYETGTSLSPFS